MSEEPHDGRYALLTVVLPTVVGSSAVLAVAAFSDSTITALITAGPPTLAAIFAGLLGWMNHRQGSKIHVLVNSNMTAVKTDLVLANNRIEKLQLLVAELTERADAATKAALAVQASANQPELMVPIPPTTPKPIK